MEHSLKNHTLENLLDAVLKAEELGRDFYYLMSRAFSHEPSAADLWASLMKDEAHHIAALKRIQARLSDEELQQPVDADQLNRASEIPKMLAQVRISAIDTLDDAYELAHEYEHSELNRLFKFLATNFVSTEERKTFLIKELVDHQAKLVKFGLESVVRETRRTIPIQWPEDIRRGTQVGE